MHVSELEVSHTIQIVPDNVTRPLLNQERLHAYREGLRVRCMEMLKALRIDRQVTIVEEVS